MDYCKYHPLTGATYSCNQCEIHMCDDCIGEDAHSCRCILCSGELESVGSANNVEPFWRRLPQAFKYPLNSACMGLIAATSAMSVLAVVIPLWLFSLILSLVSFGAILKYSFLCLEKTAEGDMTAPGVTDAYHGGVGLVLQLFLLMIALILATAAIGYFLGAALAGIIGIWILICLPAMMIRFAATQNMADAINPMAAFRLVLTIGLPYGLLIAFIGIMMTSVGVLHEWLDILPMGSLFLQTMTSSYYMIVIFHIMGYMLFQYQQALGYVARSSDADQKIRSDADRLMARINVNLKEGYYEEVVRLYYLAFKKHPGEKLFFDRYFEFLSSCKKNELMADYALSYLQFTIAQRRFDKLSAVYRQIAILVPDYIPDVPEVRLQLARSFKQLGDMKMVVKMINGMHKRYPAFGDLIAAYSLMAEALDTLPGMQEQAGKCRQLLAYLEKNKPLVQPELTPVPQAPAMDTKPPTPDKTVPVDHGATADLPAIDFFSNR